MSKKTYYCYFEEEGKINECEMILCRDAEHAASTYAQQWDCGDYVIANGWEPVLITEDEDGNIQKFKIRAVQSLDYYADLIKEAPDETN